MPVEPRTMNPMHPRYLALLFLLIIPFSAHAEKNTVWNFQGTVPGEWEVKGLTNITPTGQGVHIVTNTLGKMTRSTEWSHRVDAVHLTYTAYTDTKAYLLWHVRGTPENDLVQFPFTLTTTNGMQQMDLNIAPMRQWDPRADVLGIAFEPGSNVLIADIEFRGWNPVEKLREAFISFWTFDSLRPYSINFLWGPLLGFSPVERAELFLHLPPLSHSANRLLYVLLGIGFMWLIIKLTKEKDQPEKKQKAILQFFLLLAGLWFLYDIRMGAEIISYAQHDWKTYHLETPSRAIFRERKHFIQFAETVQSYTVLHDKYVFMASERWPYLGLIRYYTYPSLPTMPERALQDGLRLWVVYERPDILLNSEGALVVEGQVVSLPGRIVHEFEPGTFLFESNLQ